MGLTIVREVLEGLGASIPIPVRDRVLAKLEWLGERDSFLACMSTSPHVLSQWRAYADGGSGYCIGFRIDDPLSSRGYHGINWFRHLLECEYDRRWLENRLKERFQRKIDRVASLPATGNNKDDVLALELAMVAWRYAHLTKHHHFKEEGDWGSSRTCRRIQRPVPCLIAWGR